ncbi:MAG: thiosulfate oxidation carrier protein SoxY [Methylotenera sp.]|nr:thiosulfate oxidation carrier protein SoxY [Methylotenera sp.]
MLLQPLQLLAMAWNRSAFDADKVKEASNELGISEEVSSQEIHIIAPKQAENGAIVQVEISSGIPNTQQITVLVENNPTVLIAHFVLHDGVKPEVVTRIKMAETSDIKVVVKAGSQYFTCSQQVSVLENGCG